MKLSFRDEIRERVSKINRLITRGESVHERLRQTVLRAERWLQAGGLCSYTNEDFDVLNALVSAESAVLNGWA